MQFRYLYMAVRRRYAPTQLSKFRTPTVMCWTRMGKRYQPCLNHLCPYRTVEALELQNILHELKPAVVVLNVNSNLPWQSTLVTFSHTCSLLG